MASIESSNKCFPNQNNTNIFLPARLKSDQKTNNNYNKIRFADTARFKHNGSTVSDNISVIPWDVASSEEVVCDSSTSPINPTMFQYPDAPSNKFPGEKLERHIKPLFNILPADYLLATLKKNNPPDPRPFSTATSLRSTNIDFESRNSSRFSSPRLSARGKKRHLSVSPISSDLFDLAEIIRTSPNSLVAYVTCNDRNSFISRASGRNSSTASRASNGSFGHLSVNSLRSSPVSGSRQKNPFPGLLGDHKPKLLESAAEKDTFQPRQLLMLHPPSCADLPKQLANLSEPLASPQVTSSTSGFPNEGGDSESDGSPPRANLDETTPSNSADEDSETFFCGWKDCKETFDAQPKLVQHVNTFHIQKNKKDCSCYWHDCSRKEKPFKAMYMLVVHVRRHTGEKPHKCHYAGCAKAYSRLENLKTHLRSHTGERPYGCEVLGCNKAFSNASDRAKHQNRTHSDVKQYGCKVPGCEKRYTDPSSLRKHMKTVHGFHAQPTKKLKGDPPRKKDQNECVKMNSASVNQMNYHQEMNCGYGPVLGTSYANVFREQAPPEAAQQFNYLPARSNDRSSNVQVEVGSIGNLLSTMHNKPASVAELIRMPNNKSDRRGSNTSTISTESNALSGYESNSNSRRGSDMSIQSFLSGGRRSTNLASPRNMVQTVIEEEELEHIISSNGQKSESFLKEYEHLNRQSRVSSGYDSTNTYFPLSRSPGRFSPTMSVNNGRRASEGTPRRMSDEIFKNARRRCSEPVEVSSLIDQTPRRQSMSVYNKLPDVTIKKLDRIVAPAVPSNNIVQAMADSTMEGYGTTDYHEDPLTSFVNNMSRLQEANALNCMKQNEFKLYHQELAPEHSMSHLNNMYNAPNAPNVDFLHHTNPAYNEMQNINFPQICQQQASTNHFKVPQQENLYRCDALHGSKKTQHALQFTQEWRDTHFTPKQPEPDSTVAKCLEEMIVNGLDTLSTNTAMESVPPSNMVVNTMKNLIDSFVEEDQYFHNQVFP